MKALDLVRSGTPLTVLCIGAHSDDIEIGCGATLLDWIARGATLDVHWAVLSATDARRNEARASAADFLAGARRAEIEICGFEDGFFPYQGSTIKSWFETLKKRINPEIVFCHWRDDAHQDHREVSKLVWNSFRDHVVLEYEIPKWDGDLGRPNVYIATSRLAMERKAELLIKHFGSQRSKDWFTRDTFQALARLRGNECRAADGFAEAFHARKLLLA